MNPAASGRPETAAGNPTAQPLPQRHLDNATPERRPRSGSGWTSRRRHDLTGRETGSAASAKPADPGANESRQLTAQPGIPGPAPGVPSLPGPATTPTGPGPGAGAGLIGMRQRVGVWGGQLETGPTLSGGWKVHATLPWDQEEDDSSGSDPPELKGDGRV